MFWCCGVDNTEAIKLAKLEYGRNHIEYEKLGLTMEHICELYIEFKKMDVDNSRSVVISELFYYVCKNEIQQYNLN
jgi:hypothetical protein